MITMVTYCCVRGCKNNSDNVRKESKDVSFHEFPSEPELRQKWLQAIGQPQWDPPSYIRICSAHFSVDQINYDGPIVKIKEEAYPVNLPACIDSSNEEVCRICLITDVKMYSLQHGILKQCMEELAEFNDKYNKESFPPFACYECGAQLMKYYRFVQKSIIAQTILLEILEDNGQITKKLVNQKDRNQLKLQSTLDYSEPGTVIELVRKIRDSKIKIDKSTDEKEGSNREKYSRKSKNPRKRNIASNENSNKNKMELNIPLKSEASDNDEHDIEDIECNAQNVSLENKNIAESTDTTGKGLEEVHETLKLEFETPQYYKVEKLDSDSEDRTENFILRDETSKNTIHLKFETTAIDNEPEDRKRNFASMNRSNKQAIKTSHSKKIEDIKSDDDDSESSDEDLLSIKNNVKRNKISRNSVSIGKKKSTKAPARKRKKKRDEKEPPDESVLEKLKCYKIVTLSLQEQIDEWKKENEQSVHCLTTVFQCEICTKKFLRKKAYEQHLSYHKPSRGDVECPVCMERFQSKVRLDAHTTRTHAKRYECTKCPKVLHNLIRARRHEMQHSGKMYTCPHCDYSTRHRSAVWDHTRRQHPHAHHCARCGHAFITAKGLAQHKNIAHPDQDDEPKDPHPCEQCNIVFHSEGALRVHEFTSKLHENPDPAPVDQALKLTCKRCGESFAKRRDLWAHAEKEHEWVARPTLRKRGVPMDVNVCEHCDKEIKNRFEYWCHLRREHPNLKHTFRRVITAICDKCGKGFNNPSLLKIHSLSHGSARYACASCPRVFHDPHALARHAYSHTPDRPHACAHCGRAFKLKGNLDRHMRTHTGETPYECSFCGKKFKYWSSMSEHEKHMHQKIPYPPRDRRAGGTKKGSEMGRI